MISGNLLNPNCLVFPYISNECSKENTSVVAEGLFLDCTPIFGFHCSDFPRGPESCLCVLCLMTFPYSFYPELPGSQHMHYTCEFVI